MADPTSERGDFVVFTGAEEHPPDPPPGYRRIGGARGSQLFVRPGFGAAVAERPFGAIVVCGSSVERLEHVADRAGRELLTSDGGFTPHQLTAHFRDVVGHLAVAASSGSEVWTLTDHLGTIPVFRDLRGRAGTSLWPFLGGHRALDTTSVREFVSSGRITAPHTVLDGVQRQAPATAVSTTGEAVGPYWRPPEPDLDGDEVAVRLRGALMDVLSTIAASTNECSLLYSGGEDARIVGALARRNGIDVHGLIFLDRANRELRKARLAASLSGIELGVRRRGANHDALGLQERVASGDPGFDLLHGHAHGLIHQDDVRPVLDGWFAALYKADDVPQHRRSWRGIPLGSARATILAGAARFSADERRIQKSAMLDHLPADSRAEWLEYYPASDAPTYGFFAFNQRTFSSLSPLALHPLVELGSRVRIGQRLNRNLYKQAFGRSIGPAAWIPRTDGEVLALGSRLDLCVAAANKTVYKLTDRIGRRSSGPWQTNEVRRAAAARAMETCDPTTLAELIEVVGTPHGWDAEHRLAQLAIALHRMSGGTNGAPDGRVA